MVNAATDRRLELLRHGAIHVEVRCRRPVIGNRIRAAASFPGEVDPDRGIGPAENSVPAFRHTIRSGADEAR